MSLQLWVATLSPLVSRHGQFGSAECRESEGSEGYASFRAVVWKSSVFSSLLTIPFGLTTLCLSNGLWWNNTVLSIVRMVYSKTRFSTKLSEFWKVLNRLVVPLFGLLSAYFPILSFFCCCFSFSFSPSKSHSVVQADLKLLDLSELLAYLHR